MVVHKQTLEESRVRIAITNFIGDNEYICSVTAPIERMLLEDDIFKLIMQTAKDAVKVLDVLEQEELGNTILENAEKLAERDVQNN